MLRLKHKGAAMTALKHADTFVISQTADVWRLSRSRQTLAIIERSWDDYHWLLFLADADGELVCRNAYRRTATLKACLRLWAQHNAMCLCEEAPL